MLTNTPQGVKLYNKVVILPDFEEEKKLWSKGFKYIIGIDEVGRGAFAGPVCTAGVVFECETKELMEMGINDSKLLKASSREKLAQVIKEKCLSFSIQTSEIDIINNYGIVKATEIAFKKTVEDIVKKMNILSNDFFILVDGFESKELSQFNQKGIIKGDRNSISIAAASIIAKVYRDDLMTELSKIHPEYNLAKHKGYGTREHREAIKKNGLSIIHRTSFNLTKFI